ncbi:MAG: PH domain-containing protein [Clostridiales bacterium]|nr:PH domain-containing protein [Clostridiales bacterium]
MGRYVEHSLYEGEWVVEKAPRDVWGLVGYWILGILFFFLIVPLIVAIKETVIYTHTELVLTNRRLIFKRGVWHTKTKDIPLPKVKGVSVETKFWGRIFNVSTIYIDTEYGTMKYKIQDAEDFRTTIIGQIDQFERDRLADQSAWMAQALLRGMKNLPNSPLNPPRYGQGYGAPAYGSNSYNGNGNGNGNGQQPVDPYGGYGRDPFSREK